ARSQVLTIGAVLRRMLAQAPDETGGRGAVVAMSSVLASFPELLAPGGVAVVRTFRHEAGAARLPKRRYCLEAGELLELFPASRFDILAHVEDRDPDGRPAAGVVARLRVTRGS
ncbi:hypothetical protein HGA89_02845, partial [bacterium]|nr:hypothetical protein [bacterium]